MATKLEEQGDHGSLLRTYIRMAVAAILRQTLNNTSHIA
jgi:hypothetical protein